MTFQEAVAKVGKPSNQIIRSSQKEEKKPIHMPPSLWIEKGEKFIESCCQRLLAEPPALELLQKRGLSSETIKKFRLGWNPVNPYLRRSNWGIQESEGYLYFRPPIGITIPMFYKGALKKIRIRRRDWKNGDVYGKYYQFPRSTNQMPVFGDVSSEVVILVEAELDAIFIVQEAGDLCSTVALTGAQNKPDALTFEWLKCKRLILFSLDRDEAGRKEYSYWRSLFEQLRPWQANSNKSPADASIHDGVNLKSWVESGIMHWRNVGQTR
jgi:hypothetical protein